MNLGYIFKIILISGLFLFLGNYLQIFDLNKVFNVAQLSNFLKNFDYSRVGDFLANLNLPESSEKKNENTRNKKTSSNNIQEKTSDPSKTKISITNNIHLPGKTNEKDTRGNTPNNIPQNPKPRVRGRKLKREISKKANLDVNEDKNLYLNNESNDSYILNAIKNYPVRFNEE